MSDLVSYTDWTCKSGAVVRAEQRGDGWVVRTGEGEGAGFENMALAAKEAQERIDAEGGVSHAPQTQRGDVCWRGGPDAEVTRRAEYPSQRDSHKPRP